MEFRELLMTIRDLGTLESAVEQGQAAHKLLFEWRTSGLHGLSFDQFVSQMPDVILSRPRWEGVVASSVMDVVIAQSKMVEKIDAGKSFGLRIVGTSPVSVVDVELRFRCHDHLVEHIGGVRSHVVSLDVMLESGRFA